MKSIVTITGIRPDFIRMSEIFKKLDHAPWCNHTLVHTGQHYDKLLSDIFFEDLEIRKPDFNLQIGSPGKKHYQQQAELGPAIIELLEKNNISPDLIVFLGDSNSVLASVPLRKEGFNIAHIEAGMRSYDERMLEEINRKVCDHVSNKLFVYHENYKQKAIREGIPASKIEVVGNTIIEPLNRIADMNYIGKQSHILLDIHRPENFNSRNRLKNILNFANFCNTKSTKTVKMLKFGRTIQKIEEFNLDIGNIELVDLMGYKKFVRFMQDSSFIISDSGTAQEEPCLLKIPVIVPRDFTERPESVENNCSIMIDVNTTKEFETSFEWAYNRGSSFKTTWLGTGDTSNLIIGSMEKMF